ncbi:tyrosine-protein phosphatase [Acidobacteriota bacterium]
MNSHLHSSLYTTMIDIHCHILPGIDDGASDVEESLKMARFAEQDGVKTIIATPHVFRPPFIHKNLFHIQDKWSEFSALLKANNIQVDLLLGSEVHFVHNLIDVLKINYPYFGLNRGSYMIVEFPSNHVFSGVKQLFFDLTSRGLNLIIAHPERNSVFVRDPGLLYELIKMGVYVQANSGSFSSFYGTQTKEAAFRFLEWNFYHFLASDSHGKHKRSTRLSKAFRKIQELAGDEMALALVEYNPKAVVEDREISLFKDPINPTKKKKTFFVKIPNFSKGKLGRL